MKIALVAHKYPPFSLGGTEVYTRNLARGLQALGHQPLVYFRADLDSRSFTARDEVIDGIPARRVSAPLAGWRSFPLVEFVRTFCNPAIERDWAAYLQREQPDIVHFQHVMALSARLIPLAAEMGFPVVLTLHDYWFICANAQLVRSDARICANKAGGLDCGRCAMARFPVPGGQWLAAGLLPLFRWRDATVRRSALVARRMIAPSRFLMQQYLAAGFPEDRLLHLENGIDGERIAQERVPRAGPLRVTYLGSLAWQKGVHVLVEAFRGIDPVQAQLRVFGDPSIFPDYAARLQAVSDERNTHLMGRVANDHVGSVLAETDVLVVPSLWYENSPVVIQEAFAAGVPVVASRIGALTEKVQDGISGLLFPPGDVGALRRALESLIAHPERLDEYRVNIARPISLQEHLEKLLDVYHLVGHS